MARRSKAIWTAMHKRTGGFCDADDGSDAEAKLIKPHNENK